MIVVAMMTMGVRNLLGVEEKVADMTMITIINMEMDVDMEKERARRVKKGKEVRMLMRGSRIIRGREKDDYEWAGRKGRQGRGNGSLLKS